MADQQTPPPENPYDMQNGSDDSGVMPEANGESLPQNTPGVAAKPGKALIVLGGVAAIIVLILVNIFSGGEEKPEPPPPREVDVAPKPKEPPKPPKPKEPEPDLAPPPPIDAPPIPQPLDLPIDPFEGLEGGDGEPIDPEADSAARQQALARLKSQMVILKGGGGGGGVSGLLGGGEDARSNDPDAQFAAEVGRTKVETVVATRIADLNRTIAQGRIIQATMETALNTDLAAPIRAIVSRDTYGESGREPLIPKGSRLIGRYNTSLTAGQTRVFVIWTRVIRPDGVDVALNSPLVDAIGQAGVGGQYDSRFQEIFSRALVSSVINIATAVGAEEVSGDTKTVTTTSPEGGSQTEGSAVTEATANALNRLGSITDGFIQRFINVRPTILIDQGTPVNVFVNKDVVFPVDVMNSSRMQ
jgi:type IV secretion system protein VirB10